MHFDKSLFRFRGQLSFAFRYDTPTLRVSERVGYWSYLFSSLTSFCIKIGCDYMFTMWLSLLGNFVVDCWLLFCNKCLMYTLATKLYRLIYIIIFYVLCRCIFYIDLYYYFLCIMHIYLLLWFILLLLMDYAFISFTLCFNLCLFNKNFHEPTPGRWLFKGRIATVCGASGNVSTSNLNILHIWHLVSPS